ncbi:hypothetical protein JCM10213_003112 [Rhodosporidiobolus nylandii]
MPPTRRTRQASNASSSGQSAPAANPPPTTRTTRQSTRAVLPPRDSSPHTEQLTRSTTPESNNEPSTPPDEPLDLGEEKSAAKSRPTRRRTPSTKALEADPLAEEQHGAWVRQDQPAGSTSNGNLAATAASKKRGRAASPKPVKDESNLTHYNEPASAPKRARGSGPAETGEKEVEKAAAEEKRNGEGETARAEQAQASKPVKGQKSAWTFDFLPSRSLAEEVQPVAKKAIPLPGLAKVKLPPARPSKKRPAAPPAGPAKVIERNRRKAGNSGAEQSSFEVLLYDQPFAVLKAYARPSPASPSPSSRGQSSSPSSAPLPLKPLAVLRCNSSTTPCVRYIFPLPDSDDPNSIERIVIRVKGEATKARGPERAAEAVILEEDEGEREARWVLVLRGKEAKWVVR